MRQALGPLPAFPVVIDSRAAFSGTGLRFDYYISMSKQVSRGTTDYLSDINKSQFCHRRTLDDGSDKKTKTSPSGPHCSFTEHFL